MGGGGPSTALPHGTSGCRKDGRGKAPREAGLASLPAAGVMDLPQGVPTTHPHISSWLRGWAQSRRRDRVHLEQGIGHGLWTQTCGLTVYRIHFETARDQQLEQESYVEPRENFKSSGRVHVKLFLVGTDKIMAGVADHRMPNRVAALSHKTAARERNEEPP